MDKEEINEVKDLLGNNLNVGDLILFAKTDIMPNSSKIEKVTATRCYFPSRFSNKAYSYIMNSFRIPDQIVSLTALGICDSDFIGARYKSSSDHKDITGKVLQVGARVVCVNSDHRLSKGVIVKISPNTCSVSLEQGSSVKTYSTYVLQY